MEIDPVILNKVESHQAETQSLVDGATKDITDFDTSNLRFTAQISAPIPDLTKEERDSSMVFVFRYEHLPQLTEYTIAHHRGRHYLNEVDNIRAGLNEYRSIFWNNDEPVFYGRISNIYRDKLVNRDPSKGLSITAIDPENNDVTLEFVKHLDSKKKAIRSIIKLSDFDYLFNGALQHSALKYSDRLLQDYYSGEMNYILLRNMTYACYLKNLFHDYYRVINILNFPRMGGL